MKIEEFIQLTLVYGISQLQQSGGHYFSFSLMAQGIELLGACLDDVPFHQSGQSGNRFRSAIQELFPPAYRPFNDKTNEFDLFSNLRCGLLHVVLPKNRLELIQRSELNRFPCGHLGFDHQRGNKRLVLVSEDFFADFEQACLEVIRRIETGILQQEKVKTFRFLV